MPDVTSSRDLADWDNSRNRSSNVGEITLREGCLGHVNVTLCELYGDMATKSSVNLGCKHYTLNPGITTAE